MTRKFLSKNHTFTVITQFFGVLTVLIALVPLAQTMEAGPAPVQPDSNPLLFFPAVGYDSGGTAATSVAVADLNGDGKPDVIVANWCGSNSNCNNDLFGFDGTVDVLLGNGDGTLQPASIRRICSGDSASFNSTR
jgi:hypothetical protein